MFIIFNIIFINVQFLDFSYGRKIDTLINTIKMIKSINIFLCHSLDEPRQEIYERRTNK